MEKHLPVFPCFSLLFMKSFPTKVKADHSFCTSQFLVFTKLVCTLITCSQKATGDWPAQCSGMQHVDQYHVERLLSLNFQIHPHLPLVLNSRGQLKVSKIEMMEKIVIFVSYFSTGFTDNQYRWKPGVCGCSGVVPDRHVQPVSVWPARCLLLSPAGERPEHKAARRERPDRYSGGTSWSLPMYVVCVEFHFFVVTMIEYNRYCINIFSQLSLMQEDSVFFLSAWLLLTCFPPALLTCCVLWELDSWYGVPWICKTRIGWVGFFKILSSGAGSTI